MYVNSEKEPKVSTAAYAKTEKLATEDGLIVADVHGSKTSNVKALGELAVLAICDIPP